MIQLDKLIIKVQFISLYTKYVKKKSFRLNLNITFLLFIVKHQVAQITVIIMINMVNTI